MARAKNPETEQVKKRVLADHQKGIKPKELAEKYGISVNTIKSWIKRANHSAAGANKGASGGAKKRGAPVGNTNATGNRGGPPPGSKNNLRHGAYERVMGELLEEDEAEIFNDVDGNLEVEARLLQTLAALDAKEVRLIKRINQIKEASSKNMMLGGVSKSVTDYQVGSFRRNPETGKYDFTVDAGNSSGRGKTPSSHTEETSSNSVSVFDALGKLETELDKTQGRKIRVLAELEKIRAIREQAEREQREKETPLENAENAAPLILIPDNGRNARPKGILMPQAGPQTMFMTSAADIVIYGGAAGGGKTYALLLEALRHRDVDGFGGVIFRKNYNQITAEGGLWDASLRLYSQVPDAHSGKTPRLHWVFNGKAKLSFAHLEREEDLSSWQGTEIAYIGFDELTHFTRRQFLYMLSRNRSTCGIAPYVRATCNPDADSWVAEFISWWIDPDSGYPIPERSGQIRWMLNLNDIITWYPTREDAVQQAVRDGISEDEAALLPKSVTFIASSIYDNKVLMEINPQYLGNLRGITMVDMERLLKGNWKIKAAAGLCFRRTQVQILEALPTDVILWARGWDLAATSEDEAGDPAYTASVLIGKRRNGRYIIADVINQRISAAEVRTLVKMTAAADKQKYKRVVERLPQDPGQAGKEQAQSYVKMLAGYLVRVLPESGSKEARAEPMAAQWQAGNMDVLAADWNEMYFNQLESFPESKFKDMVDAGSSAFNEIEHGATYSAPVQGSALERESPWRR